MIEIRNLTKSIGGNTILNDISFSVKKGEILGFLGPNGAGKSSTMKIITTFWSPTAGDVEIDGLNTKDKALEVRDKIGYLPETVPLYEDMKVYEYLRFIAEIRGIAKDKQKDRIKEVIEDCGLQSVIRKPIEELSKGYRQRVGLAQAIMHNPDVLILDEPTTGLDPNQIVEIRDLIKRIGKEKTVIFSTHILGEVSATCDRVIIINGGRIVSEGRPDELIRRATAKELIYVKIKGPGSAVMEKLKSISDIVDIKIKDNESEEVIGYEVEAREGTDPREKLSRIVMENNWSILEFSKTTITLEDAFRELTKNKSQMTNPK